MSAQNEKIQTRIEQLKSQLESVTHGIQQAMAQQNAIAGAIAELQNAQSYLNDSSTREGEQHESEERKEERTNEEASQEVNPLNESECA